MKRLAELSRNPLVRITLGLVIASIALTAAWRWTPLNEYITTERVVGWVERLLPAAEVTRTQAGHFLQEEVPDVVAEAVRSVARRPVARPD